MGNSRQILSIIPQNDICEFESSRPSQPVGLKPRRQQLLSEQRELKKARYLKFVARWIPRFLGLLTFAAVLIASPPRCAPSYSALATPLRRPDTRPPSFRRDRQHQTDRNGNRRAAR